MTFIIFLTGAIFGVAISAILVTMIHIWET